MHVENTPDPQKPVKHSASFLKRERELRGMTQSEVAERIGTNQITISRWENGFSSPTPYYRQKLSKLFGKSIQELGLLDDPEKETPVTQGEQTSNQALHTPLSSASPSLPLWHMPYRRNPFFTGRDDILTYLHDTLKHNKTASLTQAQAISGLGGIGKTQIAIEYAYRYREEYHAIFYTNASTYDTLRNDYKTIATLLKLPEHDDSKQHIIVQAVKHWFSTHTGWLLILDNVDDLDMLATFLPEYGMGEVLLTTRLQALGTIAQNVTVETMPKKEGCTFLLRRIKAIASDASIAQPMDTMQEQAEEIVAELDGLPLALDQAGAYIEETHCSLSQYIHLYKARSKELLLRRGRFPINHPESVATTWSLSFRQIERECAAAAELLSLLAFLDPESIPEELLSLGAAELGPVLGPVAADPLTLDSIIELLLRYSLIQRNAERRALSIHRLVQVVLKESMDREAQRFWAERTIRAVNSVFPDGEQQTQVRTWELCSRCLPHVEICMPYVKDYRLALSEAAHLFNEAASYLIAQARYDSAELLLRMAKDIRYETVGVEHVDTARTLNDLGLLYLKRGRRYQEAKSILQEALKIRQQLLPESHPAIAETLNNLANSFYDQGDYAKAEPFYLQALSILENASGIVPSLLAQTYYSLSKLFYSQERYKESQYLLKKAFSIQKECIGETHPATASILTMLGKVYQRQNEFAQAEKLHLHALMIRESISGPNHRHIATILNNMVELYHAEERFDEAQPLISRALNIHRQSLGANHPYIAYTLSNLAENLFAQGDYIQAEVYYKQALAIREQQLGFHHPRTADAYYYLGQLYIATERFEEAEILYRNIRAIWERAFGFHHPVVIRAMRQYANILRKLNREDESQEIE